MARRKLLPFHCTCGACENDYPISNQLKHGPIKLPDVITQDRCIGDRNGAFAQYKLVVNYLEKVQKHIPCAEHAELYESYLRNMFAIFGKEFEVYARVMANVRRSGDGSECHCDSDDSLEGLRRLFTI